MWDLISILVGFGSSASERWTRSGISYPRPRLYTHWDYSYRKKQIMVDGDGGVQGNGDGVGEPAGEIGTTNGNQKLCLASR